MSHGHHDSHEAHAAPVEIKKPKPREIAKKPKGESLEEATEAIAAAEAFLSDIRLNFAHYFRALELEGVSRWELDLIEQQMNSLVSKIETKIQEVQEQFDIPDAMKPLLDVKVPELTEKKKNLEVVHDTAKERKERVSEEKNKRDNFEQKERLQKREFINGIEKSGISYEWVFEAVSEVDLNLVDYVIDNQIESYHNQGKRFLPGTERKIFEMNSRSTQEWKDFDICVQQVADEISHLEHEKNTIEIVFQNDDSLCSERYRELKKDFYKIDNLLSDFFTYQDLEEKGKLKEAQTLLEEARTAVEKLYKEELAAYRKKEEKRIEEEQKILTKKRTEKVVEMTSVVYKRVQKEIPEQVLQEILKNPDFSLPEVSKHLAERILKEKGGIQNIDMDLVFSLPESVLDAMVDSLNYGEIAQIVLISQVRKDELPPIYYSKSFETKLKTLGERFHELEHESLFYASEHFDDLSPEKKREFEKKQAEFVGLRKAYDLAGMQGKHHDEIKISGEYNEFFVPELRRIMEMKQIREALCGQIDEFGVTRLTVSGEQEISLVNGELLHNKKPFPDSHHNTGSAPMTHHLRYGFSAAERLNPNMLGVVDFKKAMYWLNDLYSGQVVGKEEGRDKPLAYNRAEALALRREAEQMDSEIESRINPINVRDVVPFGEKFEEEIRRFEAPEIKPDGSVRYNLSLRKEVIALKDSVKRERRLVEEVLNETPRAEKFIPDRPKASTAQNQLIEAKRNFFDRKIAKLRRDADHVPERIVGVTQEDYDQGKKFFLEKSKALKDQVRAFETKKKNLAEEKIDLTKKLPVLQKAIHDNVVLDLRFHWWDRKKTAFVPEKKLIEVDDATALGGKRREVGYVLEERILTKKQIDALKRERVEIEARLPEIDAELKKLVPAHETSKKEIQNDIDKIIQLFPILEVDPKTVPFL